MDRTNGGGREVRKQRCQPDAEVDFAQARLGLREQVDGRWTTRARVGAPATGWEVASSWTRSSPALLLLPPFWLEASRS